MAATSPSALMGSPYLGAGLRAAGADVVRKARESCVWDAVAGRGARAAAARDSKHIPAQPVVFERRYAHGDIKRPPHVAQRGIISEKRFDARAVAVVVETDGEVLDRRHVCSTQGYGDALVPRLGGAEHYNARARHDV
jgi:hypothetical protein